MTKKIIVKGILPSRAYYSLSDIPSRYKKYKLISTHTKTPIGKIHAYHSARKTNLDYTKTHGNSAARKIVIIVNGKKYGAQRFKEDFLWSLSQKYHNKI